MAVDVPHAEGGPVKLYVRPHELDILAEGAGDAGLAARVVHVNPLGSVTRVLVAVPDFNAEVNVDVTPERSRALALRKGDAVYVAPQRVRVFGPPPDYSI